MRTTTSILALCIALSPSLADAKIVSQVRFNNGYATAYYSADCKAASLYVGRYKEANTNETSLSYTIWDWCMGNVVAEGNGIIPDSSYTGSVKSGLSLNIDVSTVPGFYHNGEPLVAQIEWKNAGLWGDSWNGVTEHWSINNGVKSISRTRGHAEQNSARVSGVANLFDASQIGGYLSDSLNIVVEFEKSR